MTYITAHSGCEGTPAGSMESITRALELGADFIEVDVRRSPEGILYLSHDVADPAGLLTLDDAFAAIQGTPLRINCDLKEQSTLYPVLDLARLYGYGPEKVTISGCTSPEQLARDLSINEHVSVALNIEEILKFLYLLENPLFTIPLMRNPWELVSSMELTGPRINNMIGLIQNTGAHSLNLPYRLLSEPLIILCKIANIPLSVWTVNDPIIVQQCLDAGVENITTTQVTQALKLRDDL